MMMTSLILVFLRYYESYLAKADTRLGIQVRVFEKDNANKLGEQIFACAIEERLLPEAKSNIQSPQTNNTKAVLVTSLYLEYFDRIRNMYWEHSAATGEIITVYQPSHEGSQQLGNRNHEIKALAEMYLLSMTDELVISAWSTFGYVAQGLGNLKSWILDRPVRDKVPDPSCRRADSIEPCFHAAPHYNCEEKKVDTTMVLPPYLRRCEDVSLGIKLVDKDW
jgi:xyloglucan fucosyltransferase